MPDFLGFWEILQCAILSPRYNEHLAMDICQMPAHTGFQWLLRHFPFFIEQLAEISTGCESLLLTNKWIPYLRKRTGCLEMQ